jgi:hypothetical protein
MDGRRRRNSLYVMLMMTCNTAQDGWTPLHIASRQGHLETVKALVERRADVEAMTNVSITHLHTHAHHTSTTTHHAHKQPTTHTQGFDSPCQSRRAIKQDSPTHVSRCSHLHEHARDRARTHSRWLSMGKAGKQRCTVSVAGAQQNAVL